MADQRNVVLIGGTGTGKSHLAIGIARALIRNGTRGRFFNVVDLVNRLDIETRAGKHFGARFGGIIVQTAGLGAAPWVGAAVVVFGIALTRLSGQLDRRALAIAAE